MTDLESIKNTLVKISRGGDLLDTLIEFNRTLDNLEVFAYKNWILGELVEGPEISRYWYKTTWMYPFKKMPDPDAILRILEIDGRVKFEKGIFKHPVRVEGPEDWIDPESKRAKMVKHRVWLVTIEIPVKYVNRGIENNEEIMKKDIARADSEIEGAYEENEQAGAEAGAPVDMTGGMAPNMMGGMGAAPLPGGV